MMGVVWHGNYAKFFEDGREAFSRKFGFSYLDVVGEGLTTPVVKMNVNYKKSLHYDESAFIETTFKNSRAASLEYEYRIFKHDRNELVTTGSTMQVFLNGQGELILTSPKSFLEWKEKWGLID